MYSEGIDNKTNFGRCINDWTQIRICAGLHGFKMADVAGGARFECFVLDPLMSRWERYKSEHNLLHYTLTPDTEGGRGHPLELMAPRVCTGAREKENICTNV